VTKYNFEKFFHVSLDMLCIAGMDGHFKYINGSFTQVLGWTTEELLEKPFLEFVHPDDVAATVKEVEKLSTGALTLSFQNRYRCADGSYRHLLWNTYPDLESGLLYAIARDTTESIKANLLLQALSKELEIANEELAQLASLDTLTGLKNRRAFDEQLEIHVELSRRCEVPMSLIFIDIDHFKQLNDRHGHSAGDEALKTLAAILKRGIRASDFVARMGGDELVLILPDTSKVGALELGEKLRKTVQNYAWQTEKVTISLGVATFTFKSVENLLLDECGAELLAQADAALYHSKKNGRNRQTHSSELQEQA